MVAIGSEKYLGGHAKKAGGLPHRHASLHEPRRCRMAQGVRRHLAAQTRQPYRASEALFDRGNRLLLNSTKQSAISFGLAQRRMWASSRGGTGAGVWRFW